MTQVVVACVTSFECWLTPLWVDFEDVALVEFMSLLFTRMPCESYHR